MRVEGLASGATMIEITIILASTAVFFVGAFVRRWGPKPKSVGWGVALSCGHCILAWLGIGSVTLLRLESSLRLGPIGPGQVWYVAVPLLVLGGELLKRSEDVAGLRRPAVILFGAARVAFVIGAVWFIGELTVGQ
jgi:hypothetical protein